VLNGRDIGRDIRHAAEKYDEKDWTCTQILTASIRMSSFRGKCERRLEICMYIWFYGAMDSSDNVQLSIRRRRTC
jgi:hypothetical protein